MVQGKKQLNSKPKFAEVVIGDNEAKVMCLVLEKVDTV